VVPPDLQRDAGYPQDPPPHIRKYRETQAKEGDEVNPLDPALIEILRPLAAERRKAKEIMDAEERRYDELGEEIGMHLTLAGVMEADLGDYRIKLVPTAGRSSIQSHMLLEQGVTLEQIQAATKTGAPGLQVRVAERKEGVS
jgi:hypothetical protein